MKYMDYDELHEAIRLHKLWLENDEHGKRLCLYKQELSGRNLSYYDLRGIDFKYANLAEVDFSHADLRGADLRYAGLYGADFIGTVFDETTKGIPPIVCPEVGGFTAFKKVVSLDSFCGGYVAELYIPAEAQRSSATTRKCRCSKAKVIKFWNLDRTEADIKVACATRDRAFKYRKGEYVEPVLLFDQDRWRECSSGIHFFMTFDEARDY